MTYGPAPFASVLSARSACATRSPSPAPVASRMRMLRIDDDGPAFAAMYIGSSIASDISAGMMSVTITNDFVRTRSRYSRFATTKTFLSIAAHPRLDALRTDALQEDLMQ